MKLSVTYNPYKIETVVLVDGVPIESEKRISDELEKNDRLQRWIEPHAEWKGFFEEFYDQYNTKSFDIDFTGTIYDFEDFKSALKNSTCCTSLDKLTHINSATCQDITPERKLATLKNYYEELKEKNISGLDYSDIYNKFNVALNNEFRIVVVAPMSSGKSTLINAILGHSILPAANEATTAVITEIYDDDTETGFKVSAYTDFEKKNILKLAVDDTGNFKTDENKNLIISKDGKAVKDIIADPAFISKLNSSKNQEDANDKKSLVSLIQITCNISAVPSKNLHTVIVDTPGGNNSMNENHEKVMDEAIEDEDGAMILYIFDGTKTETNDSAIILKKIANSIKTSNNGKQSKDRILFVANRMDEKDQEQDEEKYDRYVRNSILPMLEKEGIDNPNLFLLSAQGAKLIRTEKSGEKLTKRQQADMCMFTGSFGEKEYCDLYRLYEHSSVSANVLNKMYDEIGAAENDIKRIAEINSGVPALEATLCEFIEKYAFVIKITKAANAFTGKIEDYLNDAKLRDEAASNEERCRALKEEVDSKQKKFETNKQLQSLKEKIKSLTFDETPITKEKSKLGIAISNAWKVNYKSDNDQISEDSPHSKWLSKSSSTKNKQNKSTPKSNNLTKEEATALIELFNKNIDLVLSSESDIVDKLIKEEIIKPCNDIITMYHDLVKKMRNDDTFRISSLSFTKTDKFKNISGSMKDVNSLLSQNEKTVVEEHIYYKEKPGIIFGKIARKFGEITGHDGWGYEKIKSTETKTLYDLKDLFDNEIARLNNECSNEIDAMVVAAKQTVINAKSNALKNIDGIDSIIKEEYIKWKNELSDYGKLKEKIEKTKAEQKWMTEFYGKIGKLLDV